MKYCSHDKKKPSRKQLCMRIKRQVIQLCEKNVIQSYENVSKVSHETGLDNRTIRRIYKNKETLKYKKREKSPVRHIDKGNLGSTS